MLIELSMVEQRYQAVREVLDTGAPITQVAANYGVDRRTLHRWITRYANGGLEALADRSTRPDSSPHQMAARIEARLVAMRRLHPGWGPRTLRTKLAREFGDETPSRSAIYRALVRHQLIVPAPRRRRVQDYKRWERSRAMELWQMDVVAHLLG
jgi:transposase